MFGQKLRDLDVMPVLFPLEAVLNQDDRLIGRTTDPVKFPIRAALFDRSDLHLVHIETRKVYPGLPKKKIGTHESDVGVTVDARDFFPGADNTPNQFTAGSY